MQISHAPSEQTDIAVVIPSYFEGTNIDNTLWSIVSSAEKIRQVSVAVFVIINNSTNASDAVKISNQRTQDLIDAVQMRVGAPIPYDKGGMKEGQECVDEIRGSTNVTFSSIDLFSESHAPEECNVGVARDVGFREAGVFLRENGAFVGTDADTLLGLDYLPVVVDISKTPRLAATGPVAVIKKDREVLGTIETMKNSYHRIADLRAIELYPHLDRIPDSQRVPCMPGANMVVTKSAYQLHPHFRHLSGAEDTQFSMDIAVAGARIIEHEGLGIFTSGRASERTHEAHGMGFGRRDMGAVTKELGSGDPGSFVPPTFEFQFLQSMEVNAMRKRILEMFESLDPATPNLEGIQEFMRDQGLEFSDDEFDEMVSEWRRYAGVRNLYPNFMIGRILDVILDRKFEKITFGDALKSMGACVNRGFPDLREDLKELRDMSILDNYRLLNYIVETIQKRFTVEALGNTFLSLITESDVGEEVESDVRLMIEFWLEYIEITMRYQTCVCVRELRRLKMQGRKRFEKDFELLKGSDCQFREMTPPDKADVITAKGKYVTSRAGIKITAIREWPEELRKALNYLLYMQHPKRFSACEDWE